jgi:hypothetical protein
MSSFDVVLDNAAILDSAATTVAYSVDVAIEPVPAIDVARSQRTRQEIVEKIPEKCPKMPLNCPMPTSTFHAIISTHKHPIASERGQSKPLHVSLCRFDAL